MVQTSHLLAGVRVVSLEQFIAAPYCTQILADAGAEVIKIERPGSGDPRRSYEPMVDLGHEQVSSGFAAYNRGKLSATYDLAVLADRESLRELIATADVVVSNLRPGALVRGGLDPRLLRDRSPSLIVCEISGFGGSGGPSAQWPAFDSVIQAMSGLSGLIGSSPDTPPQLAPMSTMDILAGTWAALGIGLALAQRATTGEGCLIDASMFDIGAAFLERPLTLFEFTGTVQTRGADRFSPVGIFRAADGRWVSIVIPTNDMWARCCTAIARPELVDDIRLDTVLKRAERMQDLIIPALEAWAQREGLSAAEAAERMRESGQPVGVVQSIDEVRHSEQLAHRQLFSSLRYRDGDAVIDSDYRLSRMPLMFDGTVAEPGPVPALGEHSERAREMGRAGRAERNTLPRQGRRTAK